MALHDRGEAAAEVVAGLAQRLQRPRLARRGRAPRSPSRSAPAARPTRTRTGRCRGSARSIARFETYASQQPRWPHEQSGPSMLSGTWPNSPAMLCAPRSSLPSIAMPTPTPSETFTNATGPSTGTSPVTAHTWASTHAFTEFSTTTGSRSPACSGVDAGPRRASPGSASTEPPARPGRPCPRPRRRCRRTRRTRGGRGARPRCAPPAPSPARCRPAARRELVHVQQRTARAGR